MLRSASIVAMEVRTTGDWKSVHSQSGDLDRRSMAVMILRSVALVTLILAYQTSGLVAKRETFNGVADPYEEVEIVCMRQGQEKQKIQDQMALLLKRLLVM